MLFFPTSTLKSIEPSEEKRKRLENTYADLFSVQVLCRKSDVIGLTNIIYDVIFIQKTWTQKPSFF